MISSQLSQQISNFDEVISKGGQDFEQSGLKTPSVIRISRLAVVNSGILLGSIGNISDERPALIKNRLADWIKGT